MITGFEVGAVFKIIDDATKPLQTILASVRELNKEIKLARESMAGFSGGAVASGLGGAITGVNDLALAWDRVTAASLAAARAAATSATSSARSAATAAVGGGGGFRPGIGGAHVTGPGMALPGGGHARLGGGPAMAAAAAVGYGIYQDAELLKDIHWINYHLGRSDTPENIAEVRKIIEDAMKDTMLPMKDIAKAATDEARLLKGTPGESSGIRAMPDFLRAAAAEALAKDTTMDESMKSIIGLAHMVKAYTPAAIHRLLPAFAYLSTANPAGLPQMEKSFSYAVPILQSGADVDPIATMLLGTALSTAGVTSSKSGTWLRSFVERAMPGGPKHNATLRRFGLLDENDKPTWFTDGKPDPAKALEIAGPIARAMPPEERLGAEQSLFGERGAGAFAVLGSPEVLERIKKLREEMGSEEFKNRYGSILQDYQGTAVGTAKTTLAEFNIALMRLGDTALPAATAGLKGLSAVLGWFTGGHQKQEIPGWTPSWAEKLHDMMPWSGASPLPKKKSDTDGVLKLEKQSYDGEPLTPQRMNFLQGPPGNQKQILQPVSMTINLDGRQMGMAIGDIFQDLAEHPVGPPQANGRDFFRAAGNQTDT
jgi:TP901 family phage tail tape measure protein